MITEYNHGMTNPKTVDPAIRDGMVSHICGSPTVSWEVREYDTYTREGERLVVHQIIMHGNMIKNSTLWVYEDVTPWERGHKFASPWAERLWDMDGLGFSDEQFGDSDGFGWYAFFNVDRAIMSTDTYGFVYAEVFDTEAEYAEACDATSRAFDKYCEDNLDPED